MNTEFTITVQQQNDGSFVATADHYCRAVGATQEEAVQRVRHALENYLQWVDAPFLSHESPIIIGGCGRSGTTLLRAMLDSHRNIACGPETELFLNYHFKIICPNQQQLFHGLAKGQIPVILEFLPYLSVIQLS